MISFKVESPPHIKFIITLQGTSTMSSNLTCVSSVSSSGRRTQFFTVECVVPLDLVSFDAWFGDRVFICPRHVVTSPRPFDLNVERTIDVGTQRRKFEKLLSWSRRVWKVQIEKLLHRCTRCIAGTCRVGGCHSCKIFHAAKLTEFKIEPNFIYFYDGHYCQLINAKPKKKKKVQGK